VTIPPEPSPQPTHRTPDFTTARPRFTKWQVWAAVCAVAALLAVSGILYFALGGDENTPEGQVRQVLDDFATAVDTEDQARIVDLLCAEEAANITEDDDYDPTATGAEPATLVDRQISDIHVAGENASARITFPTHESFTIHLRQEKGTWHICAPPQTNLRPLTTQPS
jgi:hypothetical protein